MSDEEDEEEYRKSCWQRYIPKILQSKFCTRRRPPRNRKVYVDNKVLPGDDPLELFNYPDNRVKSSKYTVLTFLPKNLFEQFRRIANFYFLCVALTQFLIDTPVTPITSVLPLLFVISISAIKQGYEDYLRHKADKEVNLRPTVIVRHGQAEKTFRAMDVQVGDIVKTYVNEEFPCDMILLSSEDKQGHCFITTANLDGETNLKTHYSQAETAKLYTPEALSTLRASITCKPQTPDLYTFQGVMHFGHDADPQPLGPEHLLLRGARLRNTPWVYGCAIYTGDETKMALNSKAKNAKFSRIEKKLNVYLVLFMCVLVVMCVVPTALCYWWEDKEGRDPWYFYDADEAGKDSAADVMETGLAFMVLINYIIPISLYVTIEVQKFCGSMFFNYDVEMYDEELNEPALANTSDLNEELGQVEYLFTDKTGTLTENNMTFRKCVIGHRMFEEINGMLCEKRAHDFIPVTDPGFDMGFSRKPSRLTKSFSRHFVHQDLQNPPKEMTDFLRVLVLCHTVRVDRRLKDSKETLSGTSGGNRNSNSNNYLRWRRRKNNQENGSTDSLDNYNDQHEDTHNTSSNSNNTNNHSTFVGRRRHSYYSPTGEEYEYQAASPDEKAFVEAACKYGTIYHGMVEDVHEVTYKDEMHHFKMLETLPFDAVRKRMSVIIRDANGEICLLCKGAEVAIFDRVVEGDIETTQKCIDDYARCGFRTLCLARRTLSENEYLTYSRKLESARLSLVDRDHKVQEVYSELECNLTLLGATAVEDRLQPGVPETIQALRDAGIKVWVLTGDKEETAVNISHSAGHFNTDMNEMRLTQVSSLEQCRYQMRNLMEQVKETPRGIQNSLVIDGKSLAFALRWHPLWLRELCQSCVAVLCCRMSPIQKAEVVDLIKTSPEKPVTAAIGDGANDVSMIQEADVGIGIMGKEGRQAVNNSDYAFGKFRFLRRALLMHGHLYYHRLAVLVKYFFYKNVAWITCQLYYAIFNYWSQQSLYETFHLTFYNLTSTSLPILIFGIFEQNKPLRRLNDEPKLYRSITRNAGLSWRVFLEWMLIAVYHSLVFFFGMYMMQREGVTLFSDGLGIGNYDFGTAIAFTGIVVVNIKLMVETYFWCWPMLAGYAFAAVGNFILIVLYTTIFWPNWLMTTRDLYGVPEQLFKSVSVWLCVLMTIIIALLPDIFLRGLRDQASAWAAQEHADLKKESDESLRIHESTTTNHTEGWSERQSELGAQGWFQLPSHGESRNSSETSPMSKEKSRVSVALANGEAEMMPTELGRQTVPAEAGDIIELQNTRYTRNYGSTGTPSPSHYTNGIHGYDNPALSVSGDLDQPDLAAVPTVVTITPHHRQQQNKQQSLYKDSRVRPDVEKGRADSELSDVGSWSAPEDATPPRASSDISSPHYSGYTQPLPPTSSSSQSELPLLHPPSDVPFSSSASSTASHLSMTTPTISATAPSPATNVSTVTSGTLEPLTMAGTTQPHEGQVNAGFSLSDEERSLESQAQNSTSEGGEIMTFRL